MVREFTNFTSVRQGIGTPAGRISSGRTAPNEPRAHLTAPGAMAPPSGRFGLHGMDWRARMSGAGPDRVEQGHGGLGYRVEDFRFRRIWRSRRRRGLWIFREIFGERDCGPVMSSESAVIRILAVDGHPLLRQGVIGLVADQPDMKIVGEASTGR